MYSAAIDLGCDPFPFMIALMPAANSSFATPISSSIHLLIFGPGGYRFSDFLLIGLPVKFFSLAAYILTVYLMFPLVTTH